MYHLVKVGDISISISADECCNGTGIWVLGSSITKTLVFQRRYYVPGKLAGQNIFEMLCYYYDKTAEQIASQKPEIKISPLVLN